MSEQIKNNELVSALCDDEVSGAELERAIDRLLEDEQARLAWVGCYRTKDALHNRHLAIVPNDFQQQVSARIQQEALLSDDTGNFARTRNLADRAATSVWQPLQDFWQRHLSDWFPAKPMVGAAFAASLATLVVLGVSSPDTAHEAAHEKGVQPPVSVVQSGSMPVGEVSEMDALQLARLQEQQERIAALEQLNGVNAGMNAAGMSAGSEATRVHSLARPRYYSDPASGQSVATLVSSGGYPERIQVYIINHSQTNAAGFGQEVNPYARLVGMGQKVDGHQ